MASSSGTSSGSSFLQNSASEEDLQTMMDQRKRKRMISNRESARRSRMRKQKHLDDLMAQVNELRKENQQLITSINLTSQHYLNVEADNSILKAQVSELSHRLDSLNDIIHFLTSSSACASHDNNNGYFYDDDSFINEPAADCFLNPFNVSYQNQPIMASASDFLI